MASVAPAPSSEHGSFGTGSTHSGGALPLPGDVLVIQGTHWFSHLIEFGEGLINLPQYSHVAVVSHTDQAGTLWCIEGRPGGVGYAAALPYLRQHGTLINWDQPIANDVRTQIAAEAAKMLGTPYDWTGIALDAARDLDLPGLWSENWKGTGLPPAHVVCSSYAAWLYRHFQVASPAETDTQTVEPGDWAQFIETQGWQH